MDAYYTTFSIIEIVYENGSVWEHPLPAPRNYWAAVITTAAAPETGQSASGG